MLLVKTHPLLLFTLLLLREDLLAAQSASWCISRSGSNQTALQLALDYACGPGMADCAPIQSSGLCYLPNTLQAHASYAFNSYYQKSNGAPGACDFGGTALVTISDPSYGSCRGGSKLEISNGTSQRAQALACPHIGPPLGSCSYPSSASSAGTTPNMTTPPSTTSFSPPFGSTGTGTGPNTPGFGGFSPPDYNSATMILSHAYLFLFLSGICLYFQLVSI